MYYEVYIDVVFVTNLVMDYILLRLVGILFRYKRNRVRCILAAFFGAAFSCMFIWLDAGNGVPAKMLLHGGCAIAMLRISYGLKRGGLLLKSVLALYLTGFLCGGLWEALMSDRSLTFMVFLLFSAATYCGITALVYVSESFRARMRNIYPITLSYQGKVHSAYGFYDTGNMLSDPMSGEPVSIVRPEFLEAMLPGEVLGKLKHLKENPGEIKSTELVGLQPHYLSYSTIGQEGLLLAIRLDDLCIHTPRDVVHIPRPVFALSFEPSTLGEEYKVLLNSRLLH